MRIAMIQSGETYRNKHTGTEARILMVREPYPPYREQLVVIDKGDGNPACWELSDFNAHWAKVNE